MPCASFDAQAYARRTDTALNDPQLREEARTARRSDMYRRRIGLVLGGVALAFTTAVGMPAAAFAHTSRPVDCDRLHTLYLQAVGYAYNAGVAGDGDGVAYWTEMADITAGIIARNC
jgi:hypothetical protein